MASPTLVSGTPTNDVPTDNVPAADASPQGQDPLPRWPALVALMGVVGLNFALPSILSPGPRWWLAVVVGVLLVPTVISRKMGRHDLNQICGYLVNGVETAALLLSVSMLVVTITEPKSLETPLELLRSAAFLWLTNILVFALWYWRIDAGGPHHRDVRVGHKCGAILFPQMTLDKDSPSYDESWSPEFVDYLFVAFNNSTAFSPTDAPVMSRPVKLLTMLQSLISLTIITLLTARAVNILNS